MITDERLREMATHMEGFHPANTAYGVTAAEAQAMARELLSRREADEWRPVHDAPAACHVMAARWDESEWVYGVVMSPPSKPWTHFRPLPQPPQGSTP